MNNLFGQAHFSEDLTRPQQDPFLDGALALFRHQVEGNLLYKSYVSALSVHPSSVETIAQIPFLPICFFKTDRIQTGDFVPACCFESSGTTGALNSKHAIRSLADYLQNAEQNFRFFYGSPSDYCILALLPSYLERGHSSLVAMADHLIKKSGHPMGGFFLHNLDQLQHRLMELEAAKQKTLLLGVTYALLDFAAAFPLQLNHTLVMETGGMKGRKKEMTRNELHGELKTQLGIKTVHAEYGMTELLSQAYSSGEGWFNCPPTMRIFLRAIDDPFEVWGQDAFPGRTGVINVVDLANRDSIAFVATDDLGRFNESGQFEVSGRLDNCDIRGCSLLSLKQNIQGIHKGVIFTSIVHFTHFTSIQHGHLEPNCNLSLPEEKRPQHPQFILGALHARHQQDFPVAFFVCGCLHGGEGDC